MSAAGPTVAVRSAATPFSLSRSIELTAIPPTLITRDPAMPATGSARRTKIWEFNTNLHCSIIGTCLSTGELRQIMKKLGLAPPDSTDHELHGTAVTLAARHDGAAKLLNKALDIRHKLAISQFAKIVTEDAVRSLWRDAVRRGEIPGAYWATLTHPVTTPAIIREAFGDVHMLSHLVGSANRADIRRLCQQEADKAELAARLERQQQALRDAVITRDARISDLTLALTKKIVVEPISAAPDAPTESALLRQVVHDLERRLASETRRRTGVDAKLLAAQGEIAQERAARLRAERDSETLREELDALEGSLVSGCDTQNGYNSDMGAAPRLDGVTLLYVGGRPHPVTHLRAISERLGATFLHHDGGVENQATLLPGLTSRADVVLFPVDCISHDAALTIKALCRQTGKRFIPLRSASVTALLAALRRPEVIKLADAAD
jgi:hypothetical protein